MTEPRNPEGMSRRQARTIELSIIGLCILALVFVFQPLSITLYGIGAVAVIVGGLAFNLVPMCRPGAPVRDLVKGGLIVLIILIVVILLALGATELYKIYLASD